MLFAGDEVSVHYDPMIAKLVVWGPDRQSALLKLHSCLAEYNIDGLPTNVNFLMDLASHPEFVKANVDTDFIPRHYDELFPKREIQNETLCAAAMGVILSDAKLGGILVNSKLRRKIELNLPCGKEEVIFVHYQSSNGFKVQIGDQFYDVEAEMQDKELVCFVNGEKTRQNFVKNGPQLKLYSRDFGAVSLSLKTPKFLSQAGAGGSLGGAVAPMPGVIEKINVQDGAQVKAGDPLVVMIAMKMEYVIKAPKDGKVKKVPHRVGDFVTKGTSLIEFEE